MVVGLWLKLVLGVKVGVLGLESHLELGVWVRVGVWGRVGQSRAGLGLWLGLKG